MTKKKATQGGQFEKYNSPNCNTSQLIQSTDKQAQKVFVYQCLKTRPHSTQELRNLGIYYPPARVNELRGDGLNIATTWRQEMDTAGITHRIGVYSLLSTPAKEV